LRNDDLDRSRVRPEYVSAMLEDLRWLGLKWAEGPDIGGPYAPYTQSERLEIYRGAFERLKAAGLVYPCVCSRKDVLMSLSAPHMGEDEPVYPGTCRGNPVESAQGAANWRFRVPDGETLTFVDRFSGEQRAVAGVDFGDFLVWRKDDLPSYQLACTADDASMGITEVVRGGDLIASTFRQILLYRALGWELPEFHHCPLVLDVEGKRLSKRDAGTTVRGLRLAGMTPADVVAE
jgi:glutamyl-tRNA synthetase